MVPDQEPTVTDRIPLDAMTSDALDALYDRLTKAEHEADVSVAAAAHLTTLVGKRAQKVEKTAKAQRQRADIAETELRVLRSGLRANGADPTQIQNLWAQIRLRNRQWNDEKQRANQAEQQRDQLADDLRYVLDYRGPGHAHEQPGVWDTSGKPCDHCARLEQARQHLTNLTPTEA